MMLHVNVHKIKYVQYRYFPKTCKVWMRVMFHLSIYGKFANPVETGEFKVPFPE
jgi:hypothetical protein